MSLAPDDVIDGKFRIVRQIGWGGMGAVYEGENIRIGRRVAIKVLHGNVPKTSDLLARFEREARTAARIVNPHVCEVIDLGDLPGGERYLVMEFLEGSTLDQRLDACHKMAPHDIAPIAFELFEGLAGLHEAGIIHRDVKPANVFLARTGSRSGRIEAVKIVDFGISKVLPKQDEQLTAMTMEGAFLGTPLYMSPEQARGQREIDGKSDVYSAGVILFRAVTGRLPYVAETLQELLFKIALEEPPAILSFEPELDPTFAAIVMQMLKRDPAERPTAREAQAAISAWGRAQGRASLSFIHTASARGASHSSANLRVDPSSASIPVARPGATPVVAPPPPPDPATATPWSGESPSPRGGGSKKLVVPIVVGLLALGAATAVLVVRGRATPESGADAAASASVVVTPPPVASSSVPAEMPTVAQPLPSAEQPRPEPSAKPVVPWPPARTATSVAAHVPPSTSVAVAPPPPPSVTTAPSTTPATSSSARGRKFRTNID